MRAALGASSGALRRTLLAESLVLCGAGAILGVVLARPMVSIVARYAARFSVRALEVTVDDTLLWVGAGLAIAAAILLAYVPRLPSSTGPTGFGLASGSLRITPGTNRRLRVFATTQIAFSFVLLAGAGMLVAALIALQTANTGFLTRQVLAFDIPFLSLGSAPPSARPASASAPASNPPAPAPPPPAPDLYREVTQRVGQLPGVDGVVGSFFVPWRDTGRWAPVQFTVEGYTPANGEENPYARSRNVGPGFFATLGIPLVAGREFNEDDRPGKERVVIVSQTVAQRLFPNGDALNRNLSVTRLAEPIGRHQARAVPHCRRRRRRGRRERATSAPAMALYTPYRGKSLPMRMFVRTSGDPYALVPAVTRIIRDVSANQAVDRPATLEDVRAEVLTPERLNAFVVTGFAGIALLIAVVGVAGVLAFGVSARTREFGVRLAIGSTPRDLLVRVLSEGAAIVAIGIVAGVAGGYAIAGVAASYFENVRMPGALPLAGAAAVLVGAAIVGVAHARGARLARRRAASAQGRVTQRAARLDPLAACRMRELLRRRRRQVLEQQRIHVSRRQRALGIRPHAQIRHVIGDLAPPVRDHRRDDDDVAFSDDAAVGAGARRPAAARPVHHVRHAGALRACSRSRRPSSARRCPT